MADVALGVRAAQRRGISGATSAVPLWLLAPQGLLLVVAFLVPLGVVAAMSVEAQHGAGITLAHYRQIFVDGYYRVVLLRTFSIAFAVTMLDAALAYPLALFIVRTRGLTRAILLALIYLPLLTSAVVRTFGWMVLLANNGLLNTILEALHLPTLKLLYNAAGVTIGLSHVLLPFMVLTLVSSLGNIDPALMEASQSLGASPWRTFVKVTLPLTVPGLIAGSLLVFALAISAFVTPAMMGTVRTMVMATLIYTNAVGVNNWPLASAATLVLLGITGVLVMCYQHFSESRGSREARSQEA